ncbi:hypothetical protein Htur_1082 [Haloterrigena turkmenica DSM 5511]|uniref:Uncharacterized protein n=1 Tax=Haloterrigena turkmenica (strain ATCC 51198 / DSM 5511 / JCM 9101 / NCIMB 13204 / VKM B-1734 / 4k) TaxID=543526 RepID=D2RZ50_HALTV|nr:hypothetical protein [Haloterrigena turkmenica]ADB59974.1 hypothetical protein Htur_1082 [Haloterrigena turkmenica DSM 5511]
MSRQPDDDRSRGSDRSTRPGETAPPPGRWLLSTVLQTVVAVIGLGVVLYALSRAFGIDLLGMTAAALATQTGQWIAIAVVALIAMSAAMRAVRFARAP